MALTAISHLLLKRKTLKLPYHLIFSRNLVSPSPQQHQQDPLHESPKPSSLSARLSFVFDQIDAIDKQHSNHDQTLQRIRAWRQSKQPTPKPQTLATANVAQPNLDKPERRTSDDAGSTSTESVEPRKGKGLVELVHPWPEWIELMERLVHQNYFDHRRKNEDKMVQGLGIDVSEVIGGGDDDVEVDFCNDLRAVQTAFVNFGKDRFDILRSLSRKDIQVLVGYGCPSVDKKVVFSAKLLRKRVHLDEGDVCSSCSLRNSCERGYLLTNKEDEARTIDVMRILFAYGFDPLNGSVLNTTLSNQKSVKTVIRKLLHEIVKLSAVPIDPNLPPPVIVKPPPKVKIPPPPPKKRVGRDDVEMKKGDWLCPKCDFLNFAKNTVCLQCDAKRPKRQLLPGEWECPECNFLNYRRNMACFHCDCKRPPDEFVDHKPPEKQQNYRTGMEKKAAIRPEVSNAWNFDFDDDESDGADVAAFEYADSSVIGNDNSPISDQDREGNFRVPEEAAFNKSRVGQRNYENINGGRPGVGFDDFDDEEDDIDSYEIETQKSEPIHRAASNDFSEVEDFSDAEDFRGGSGTRQRMSSSHGYGPRTTSNFSDSDGLGTDEERPGSKWKSSHVVSGHGNRGRGPRKGMSFGSEDELGMDSDTDDDFDSGPRKGRGSFKSKGSSNFRKSSFSGSDFDDDDDDLSSSRNRPGGNRAKPYEREKGFGGRRDRNFDSDRPFRSQSNDRQFRSDDRKRSSDRSRGNDRGFKNNDYDRGSSRNNKRSEETSYNRSSSRDRRFQEDDFSGPSRGSRGKDSREMRNESRNFNGPKRGGFGHGKAGNDGGFKNNDYDRGSSRNNKRSEETSYNRSSSRDRRFQEDDFSGPSRASRGKDSREMRNESRNFKGPKRGGFGHGKAGRSNDYNEYNDGDNGVSKNSRRVVER